MTITPEYIKGFADRCCQINVPGRAIILTSNQGRILRRISAFLNRNSIHCSLTTDRAGRTMLRVGKRDSLLRWSELIGFDDPVNKSKLKKILEG